MSIEKRRAALHYYRHYAGTGNHLATSVNDGHVWVLGPMSGSGLLDVGAVSSFLSTAGCSQ